MTERTVYVVAPSREKAESVLMHHSTNADVFVMSDPDDADDIRRAANGKNPMDPKTFMVFPARVTVEFLED
jgi:hypothetical protein